VLDPQRTFVEPLLAWYEEDGREELPWREPDRTAFQVLVAEILLQRTTAKAVVGAYRSFIARYPTPEAVAAAPMEEIEQRIAPLGLVKRAEFIEQCALQLLDNHAGDVPRNLADLLALHGVGEYTAKSVLIHVDGFGVAAVDANVRRLLSRYFGLSPDAEAIESLADALAPTERSSDFQHAMLDFASDVCTARSPQCESCPIGEACNSYNMTNEWGHK